jgi:hypothetical protein
VAKFTFAAETLGRALRAFSTRPTHEAQVIPSMGRERVAPVSFVRFADAVAIAVFLGLLN